MIGFVSLLFCRPHGIVVEYDMDSPGASSSFLDETPEAKALWFQSLSLEERMELFCSITDLILQNNPTIVDGKDAQQTAGNIRILSKT